MNHLNMEATVFYDSHLPDALRRALEYAGEDGYVASLPQLLHARVNAADDNEIWHNQFFTSNSEESVARTKQGTVVAVVVHGGGIFASPERFKKLYYASVDRNSEFGYTGLFSAKISTSEAVGVVEGTLPDGSDIPVFSYSEFKQGINCLPRRYAVVMDFEMAKKSRTGNINFDELKDDPLMIIRAGGVAAATAYLDKLKSREKSSVMANWHAFNDVDPDQPQTRVLFLGGTEGGAKTEVYRDLISKEQGYIGIWGTHYRNPIEAEFGIRGDTSMINMARYVAVAPESLSASLRYLPFQF